ncbi:MAG TPA: hypothetical protein VJ085_08800 [Candidatus Acidoferrales bacterium]|nr:hypothetical protein [Candidatus Acidoferrales bacterium]
MGKKPEKRLHLDTFSVAPGRTLARKYEVVARLGTGWEGEVLARQPGQRLSVFQALHLLYALAAGIECIHQLREYHGDLHTDNVIVRRYGLGFNLKLVDMFRWEMPKRENIQDDVVDMVKIFHEAVGGARHYTRLPREAKALCCGLKRSLILKKFRTTSHLRRYLETMQWR